MIRTRLLTRLSRALVLLAAMPSTAIGQDWAPTGGPDAGQVLDFAASGLHAVAATQAGVHGSEDGGQSWITLFRSPSNPGSTFSFVGAVPGAIFAQNSSGEFFRSTDAGRNWALSAIPSPGIRAVEMGYGMGRAFLVAAEDTSGPNFFFSDDLGESWSPIASLPGQAVGLFVRGEEVLTSTREVRDFGFTVVSTCFRSTDRGSTWTQIAGGDSAIGGVPGTESGPGRRVAGALLAGKHVSMDNGQTWQFFEPLSSIVSGCASTCELRLASVAALSDGVYVHAYLDFLDQDEPADHFKLWRTSDFQNWAEVPAASTLPDLRVFQSAFVENGTSIYLAGTLGIFRSDDRGVNWASASNGLGATRVWTLTSSPAALVANSIDSGSVDQFSTSTGSWTPRHVFPAGPFEGTVLRLYSPGGNTLLAGHLVDGITRSDDGGVTWTTSRAGIPQYNGTGGWQYAEIEAFAKIGSFLFAGTGEGLEARSDGGQGFVKVGRGVLRSSDNGRTWSRVNGGLRVIGRNSFFEPQFDPVLAMTSRGGTVLAGGMFLGVARTTNNGSSWSYSNSGLPMLNADVTAAEINTLVTVGSDVYLGLNGVDQSLFPGVGSLFKSTDGGLTWTDASAGLPAGIPIMAITEYRGSLFAGTAPRGMNTRPFENSDLGVYRSDDGGMSWALSGTHLAGVGVRSLHTHDGSLFAGTDHLGVWELDLTPDCLADFNADGFVDAIDYDSFILSWSASGADADINSDSFIDAIDYDLFIAAWVAGC